jgi:hypothetical protein
VGFDDVKKSDLFNIDLRNILKVIYHILSADFTIKYQGQFYACYTVLMNLTAMENYFITASIHYFGFV